MQSKVEELIVLINQKIQIDQIISDYVHLEKKGNNYIGLCPFHQDTNPSMSVSPAKGIFKCFSCGAGGNGINFLKNYKGITFIEALKELAEKADINWHDYLTEYKQKPLDPELELIYKINEEALNFFKYSLEEKLTSKNAIADYVEKRTLTKDLLSKFEIGYASSGNSLVAFLLKKGYKEEEIIKTGLVKNRDGKLQDYFIKRLIFPIRDVNKKAIGFSGRIIENSKYSKYLNTPETKAFKKGNIMYNFHNAQSQMSLKSYGIVVEGFMDVIAFEKLGISNVIATMGTAFTEQHLKQLKSITHKLILAFDNDIPGINTTIKTGKNLLQEKFDLFVMEFVGAKDIDEYTHSQSKEEVFKTLSEAIKFLDFYKKQFYKWTNKNSIDFELIRKFLALLATNDDDLATNFYLNDLANNFTIDKEVLQNQLQKIKEQVQKTSYNQKNSKNNNFENQTWISEMAEVEKRQIPNEEDHEDLAKIDPHLQAENRFVVDEQRIIKIASLNFEIFKQIRDLNYVFYDSFSKKVFELFVQYFSKKDKLNIEKVLVHLNPKEQAQLKNILQIIEPTNKVNEFLFQEAKEIIQKLELNHNQKQKLKLYQELKEAIKSGDNEQITFLMTTIRNL